MTVCLRRGLTQCVCYRPDAVAAALERSALTAALTATERRRAGTQFGCMVDDGQPGQSSRQRVEGVPAQRRRVWQCADDRVLHR
jgi:hypothetical protein